MRIGIVGVGRIGLAHAEVVSAHAAVDALVLADADPARAQAAAGKLDGQRASASAAGIDELFAGQLDAVLIAAATSAHAELIGKGVRAGLAVFCEKPVALDVATTVAVLDEVNHANATVQIGLHRRFDAGYRAARAALQAGEVGDLHRVHLVTGDQAPPPADYIPTSGGLYRDCHIHDFDILRWTTGREVVDVYALGSNRGADYFRTGGDVDNAAAVLRLDDDTLVTLQGSRYNGAGHDIRMELTGTRATYVVGLDERVPLTSTEAGVTFPTGQPWPNYWVRFTPAYVAEIEAFLDLVQERAQGTAGDQAVGDTGAATVADALEAFYVAEAADRSMREGRPVQINEVRIDGVRVEAAR